MDSPICSVRNTGEAIDGCTALQKDACVNRRSVMAATR
jgi:hypothetical protein